MSHERPSYGVLQNAVVKSSVALLLAAFIVTAFAIPVSASAGEVLHTSGYVDNYYYECTYTPTHEKKSSHSYDGYHSYYVEGYHVECNYTKYEPKPKKHYNDNNHYKKQHDYGYDHGYKHYTPDYSCKYRVHYGDRLVHIAKYYGVSVYDLAHANYIKDPNYIRAGQILYVPCHY